MTSKKLEQKVKGLILEAMCEVSLKSMLESNELMSDLYDSEELTDNKFQEYIKEIKSNALKCIYEDI